MAASASCETRTPDHRDLGIYQTAHCRVVGCFAGKSSCDSERRRRTLFAATRGGIGSHTKGPRNRERLLSLVCRFSGAAQESRPAFCRLEQSAKSSAGGDGLGRRGRFGERESI